ncbi:MAG: response regulator [Deltaproteobacteria bacterium]|nr:response regulator [Deltaproteobacteria bacterium]
MTAILIVDDSQTVRTDLTDALESSGFRTIACASLAEARTALRTQPVSLAILDVLLPDGNGIDLLELIRRDHVLGEMPVLMLASYGEVSDQLIERIITATDYIGKPYDIVKVVALVRSLLGAPPRPELVLVIDGDAKFREELVDMLTKAGFQTASTKSGSEGLQLAASLCPTAIIVDGAMTDMDGPSVVRRLRFEPSLRATPCLLLTESSAKDAEVRALEAGADSSVKKDDLGVILARTRALLRSATAVPTDTKRMLAPKRILTVDDDPEYLEILSGRLRKRGYDVVCASSGEEAVGLLAHETVDCILLDRTMAGRGGVATCRTIKDKPETRDVPLIILTATEQREAVIEGLAAGADDFVSKASGFDVLSARVQAQLRRKQIEDEQRRVREQLLRSELEASEARAAMDLAEARGVMAEELARSNAELAQANRELEAFSYSVSHDLRAPLRTISAFTHALTEDLGDKLDGKALDHIRRVLAASARMADLIDALLELSRISRAPLGRQRVELSTLAHVVLEELGRRDPERRVAVTVAPNLVVAGDARLLRILLDNLLGNAWKFTAKRPLAHIEVGVEGQGDEAVYFVKDDGAGFDMTHASRLFTPFHRLHTDSEYKGTGIGLATVHRIVERHGGKIWADGCLGEGARISFALPATGNER